MIRPGKRLTPDEWASANILYPRSAAIPGPHNPYLTPYFIEIGRAVAERRAKRVVAITAAQMGKSATDLTLIGQQLDQRPAPTLYVGPNKQFLTEQFEPRIMALLDNAKTLAAKVTRGKSMTKTRKTISGVSLRLAHAGSPVSMMSDPAELALVDELDAMVENVKSAGNPVALVERRGDTYPTFCCFVTSTPKVGLIKADVDPVSGLQLWTPGEHDEVQSPIWRLWQQGSRHHWTWPCPHCDRYFVPRLDRLRYPEGATAQQAKREAYLECPHCGGVIEEKHKKSMNAAGRYVAPGQNLDQRGIVTGNTPDVGSLSFWVSGLCSPFVTFGERAAVYVEAEALGDESILQAAVSSSFGELFAPGGVSLRDWETVASRRSIHKFGEVPVDVLRVTCAVDVQASYIAYSVRGWGARATSWQLQSGEIFGLTDEEAIWGDVANLATSLFGGMPISLMLIDSGFRPDKPEHANINRIYDFCRKFRANVRPTKGSSWPLDTPIKRSRIKVVVPGRRIPTTIELVRLDSDFFKMRLHHRLAWPEDQPGRFVLSADASDDYCKQLVAEVRQINDKGKPEWVRVRKRNEFLDCEAMNEAAGVLINAVRIPLGSAREVEEEHEEISKAPVAVPSPVISSVRTRMRDLAERMNR